MIWDSCHIVELSENLLWRHSCALAWSWTQYLYFFLILLVCFYTPFLIPPVIWTWGGQIYQRNVNFNDFLRRTEVQPYYLDLILFLWLHGLWLWLVVAFGFCLIVLILLLNFLICHFLLLSQWEGWTTKYLHVWWFVFSPRSGAWTVHVDSLHTFKSLFVYLCGSSSRYWILES